MVMGQWGNGTTGQSGNGATGSLSKPAVHNFTKKHTPYFFVKCHADDLKRISFTTVTYTGLLSLLISEVEVFVVVNPLSRDEQHSNTLHCSLVTKYSNQFACAINTSDFRGL